jgi:hypothetical protein
MYFVFKLKLANCEEFYFEKLTYFVFAPTANFDYNAATFQLYSLKPLKVEIPY